LEAQLATDTWLPSVNTVALLPAASGLDSNKNYLCKVLNDPVSANNIIWQLVAGASIWNRFGDMASPSSVNPLMDGAATPGTMSQFSRGDHRHPADTGRAAATHTHALGSGAGQVNAEPPGASRPGHTHIPAEAGAAPANSNEYTFVIDSNAALMAWANNAAGNNYSRVLIKAGISSGSWDVNISDGRTLLVVGESGSSLPINIIGTGDDRQRFHNVTVTLGFNNCNNLTNCVGTGSGPTGNGFNNCNNLTNCVDTGGTAHQNANNAFNGFNNCNNLVNCVGTGGTGIAIGTGNAHRFNGFANCNNLVQHEPQKR